MRLVSCALFLGLASPGFAQTTNDPFSTPQGGQDPIRRVLFHDKGTSKTLLQLIHETNAAQNKPPAPRADLRLGMGPQGQLFVMNKRDGVIRMIVP